MGLSCLCFVVRCFSWLLSLLIFDIVCGGLGKEAGEGIGAKNPLIKKKNLKSLGAPEKHCWLWRIRKHKCNISRTHPSAAKSFIPNHIERASVSALTAPGNLNAECRVQEFDFWSRKPSQEIWAVYFCSLQHVKGVPINRNAV